jgi:REP element-mobilizing transposase RayT
MRTARIKPDGGGFYHCISRVIDRRMILGHTEKEVFCTLMRKAEYFSCVQVLTHCTLDNHFHIVIEVPQRRELSDEEFLDRLAALYDRPIIKEMEARLKDLRKQGWHEEAERQKARYTYRMFDISEFMKTLKQRFTMWYNPRAGRKGTLWEERFKSISIEGSEHALATIAAYVDLNAVRAGIVKDPKDYRYCGYGEAVGGSKVARAGLGRIMQSLDIMAKWPDVSALYRKHLYVQGERKGLKADGSPMRRGFSRDQVEEVLNSNGKLPMHDLLRCRVRYFSDGVVLGSRTFVEDTFQKHKDQFGLKRQTGARPMKHGNWGDLFTMRDLRLASISLPAP